MLCDPVDQTLAEPLQRATFGVAHHADLHVGGVLPVPSISLEDEIDLTDSHAKNVMPPNVVLISEGRCRTRPVQPCCRDRRCDSSPKARKCGERGQTVYAQCSGAVGHVHRKGGDKTWYTLASSCHRVLHDWRVMKPLVPLGFVYVSTRHSSTDSGSSTAGSISAEAAQTEDVGSQCERAAA